MNYIMTREKNIISFLAEDKAKPYKFDVNTGVFYGLSGKPSKSCPTGFSGWLNSHRNDSNVLFLLYLARSYPNNFDIGWHVPSMNALSQLAELFRIVDKLESIGFTDRNEYSKENLLMVDKNFKDFAKYVRDNPNASIYHYKTVEAKSRWLIRHKLIVDDHLTDEVIEMLWKYQNYYDDSKTPLVAYYITHGLYDFFNLEPQSTHYSDNSNMTSMFKKIKEYFDICDKLEVQPRKEDFYRSYVNLRRTYMMNRNEIDFKALTAQYAKHPALAYENDLFKVVIPTTREDFLKEANAQQNCVYTYYLKRVVKGETNIVFIRRKDNLDKPYITCEVENTGRIRQYLGFANSYVSNEAARHFQDEYCAHLLKNW